MSVYPRQKLKFWIFSLSTEAVKQFIHIVMCSINRTRSNIRMKRQYTEMKNSLVKIWHDTMKTLRSIHTESYHRMEDPASYAFSVWRCLGERYFGLKEGVNVVTLRTPSEPSDATTAYWNVAKKCFCRACACSSIEPSHPMRVCKGCWRALYCSQRCQSM